jgi:general secretion pathway protein F
MRFQLKAIGPGGGVQAIDCQASDEASAVRTLEGRGYTVLSIRPRRRFFSPTSRFPLILFSQELRALLTAGLPLVESIETLAQREKSAEWRAVLERLVAGLREGRPLSAGLEEYPQIFSALFVASVRSAEKTSDLGPTLGRYAAYALQLDAIRRRVLNASIYPALLLAVGALVSVFLLVYVVPRFGRIYEERASDLPLFSQWLLAWGRAVDQHEFMLLGVAASLVAAGVLVLSSLSLRNLLWQVPALGERMKVYELARFYRGVGMLLRGGMPLVPALGLAAELLHPVLRGLLAAAAQAISEGQGVSRSLEANGLTTPVALRLLGVGEQGGNMGEMLEAIASFHDDELARWVDWFTRLFEPVLMAIIGLVIGAIVILMYMPIFELAGNLQ